jgi:hypothetical protein
VFRYLRDHVQTDIASAHIVISGNSVLLCDGEQLVDAVRNGQGVLNVLPLASVKSDVDAAIVALRDEPEVDTGSTRRRVAGS